MNRRDVLKTLGALIATPATLLASRKPPRREVIDGGCFSGKKMPYVIIDLDLGGTEPQLSYHVLIPRTCGKVEHLMTGIRLPRYLARRQGRGVESNRRVRCKQRPTTVAGRAALRTNVRR